MEPGSSQQSWPSCKDFFGQHILCTCFPSRYGALREVAAFSARLWDLHSASVALLTSARACT